MLQYSNITRSVTDTYSLRDFIINKKNTVMKYTEHVFENMSGIVMNVNITIFYKNHV